MKLRGKARKNGPFAPILYTVTFILCAGYVVLPFFYTLKQATVVDDAFTLSVFQDFFTNSNHIQVALNTIALGVGTVLVCGTIGIVLAVYMTFFARRFKKLLHILLLSPMMIPGVITVIAFIQLYGESGLVTKALHLLS